MKLPESNDTELEKALARLMPPALSPRAQEEIETMIDQLASEQGISRAPARFPLKRWFLGAGVAASIGAMISVVPLLSPKTSPAVAGTKPPSPSLVMESSLPISATHLLIETTATYAGADGQIKVRSVGEEIAIHILSASGETLVNRQISLTDSMDSFPAAWRARVGLLCRTLDKSLDLSSSPSREPQPRAVPPQ